MKLSTRLSRRQGLVSAALLAGLVGPGGGFAQESPVLRGSVLTEGGVPLAGARISDGINLAVSAADGTFEFDRGELSTDRSLRISASGYRDRLLTSAELEPDTVIHLHRRQVNALYVHPTSTTELSQYDALIDVINSTNANAVVLDIKEDLIWYDSGVQFFRDAGTVRPAYDLPEIMRKFRDNNIYTIARHVVFKDSIVASAYPELAVRHLHTGEPWRDQNGVAWVNPLNPELWAANIELAVEAAEAGFDEIQYDYIRFPTDGDLSTMDFGVELTQDVRQTAIESFLAESRERLLPTGAKQAADVFGFTMVVDDDLGIGQNFARLAEHVDYLCPMVYPSHYANHQFGLPGHPNDYPYEVIDISLAGGVQRLGGNSLQIRCWLQDFTYPGMTPYGPAAVRAQMQATADHDTSGWMLWDPNQWFNPDNLEPAPPSDVPNPENVY